MSKRNLAFMVGLAAVLAIIWVVPVSLAGQNQRSGSGTYTPPRTAWGAPDMQGVWSNATTTPWQRPPELAGKEFLTDQEVTERDRQLDIREAESRGRGGAAPPEWYERGRTVRTNRTSLITDPPDGRLPALTPEGKARMDEWVMRNSRPAHTWYDRGLDERCLQYRGLPPAPSGQNNNYNIVQAPNYLAIYQEHIREVRMIYTDGRPHLPVRQWMGSSRGKWEGNTLVVETKNFYGNDKYYFGILERIRVSEDYHIIERFTRVSPDMIDYTFTVTDPQTFVRPFSGHLPMTKLEGIGSLMFESACREGDHSIENILTVARDRDRKEAEAAKTGSQSR